jgi:hypothetical protein
LWELRRAFHVEHDFVAGDLLADGVLNAHCWKCSILN